MNNKKFLRGNLIKRIFLAGKGEDTLESEEGQVKPSPKPKISEPVLLFVQTYYKQRRRIKITEESSIGGDYHFVYLDGELIVVKGGYQGIGRHSPSFTSEFNCTREEFEWACHCITERYNKLKDRWDTWERIREERRKAQERKELTNKLRGG